ncbi:MAG: hypothetical protein C4326_14765 [Ignavibacteria bacterium]
MTYFPNTPASPADECIAILKAMEPLSPTKSTGGRTFAMGAVVKVTLRLIVTEQRSFVVVDDPLPAGFQIINTSLQTESTELAQTLESMRSEETQQRWWGSFNYHEWKDDRVVLVADQLRAGIHTFIYLARAITPGTFAVPPTHAEMMYEPDVFGRTGMTTIEIR